MYESLYLILHATCITFLCSLVTSQNDTQRASVCAISFRL